MAFWNNKEEIEALQQQLQQRDNSINDLQLQQQQLQQQYNDLESTLEQEKLQHDWSTKLFASVEQFGQSLTGFHHSLGTMAGNLSAERTTAIEGAETSISVRNHVEAVASGLGNITGQMDQSSVQVKSLQDNADKIGGFVEMISNISEQTNLLALNAAIEAARAGEHGRTFSVVADKIRELAEISINNAQDIKTVLSKIHNYIDVVSKKAANAKVMINKLSKSSEIIDDRFSSVKASIELISTTLEQFNQEFNTESLALKSTSKDLDEVKEVSTLLEQNAKSSQAVMNSLVQKGGGLKSLADGFEIITNSRDVQRTILTPPVKAEVFINNHFVQNSYIFDLSEKGVSFYSINTEQDHIKVGTKGRLKLNEPVHDKKEIHFSIVYVSSEEMKNIFFYGAKQV